MNFLKSAVEEDKEYQGHKVFNLLDDLIEFYGDTYVFMPGFVTSGILAGILNVDEVICGSLEGTLESIRGILKSGRISDAYALIRKYHDGIITVIYVNVYIAEKRSCENYVVQKINDWAHNRQKLPSSEKMLKTIRQYTPLTELEKLFDFDGLYSRIRRQANGNTHYNKLYYLWLNNNVIYNPKRGYELNNIYSCLKHLFVFHFAYMYSLNPHYMMSSDYLDALEFGLQPDEHAQYWVAPHIKNVFDKVVVPARPDVAQYLRENTMMHL